MARIIGALTTSHVPAIGGAIAKGLQQEPYWKPFFDGFAPVRDWLAQVKPDIAVVFYNDHGLNFFLDKMPTFAVGAAPEYRNADEGWGLPTLPPFKGVPELSWHIIGIWWSRIQHRHLPGDAGRSRLHAAAEAVLARGRLPGPDGAGLYQHRPVSVAQRETLPCAGKGRGRSHRRLGQLTARW